MKLNNQNFDDALSFLLYKKRQGVSERHERQKSDSKIVPGEGAIQALSSKWGIPFEAAKEIFNAGKASASMAAEETTRDHESSFSFSDETSLECLRSMQASFARERDWDQFHSPRNLALALVGEVGELCEIFQVFFFSMPFINTSLFSLLLFNLTQFYNHILTLQFI